MECFKKRFGREDILVEVYVRELLTLVLDNVQQKPKTALVKLFDKLESHMRALDSLGVTSDKCASMLYPLVESCLPEELLRAWQRSLPATVAGEDAAKGRLEQLMLFIQLEVEREEKIALAITGFTTGTKQTQKKIKVHFESVPTAAGLFVASTGKKNSDRSCVFCENKNHTSAECLKAQKMTFADRQNVLWEKNCCFRCYRSDHYARNCQVSVKCTSCGGADHLSLMCNKRTETKKTNVPVTASSQQALANCGKTDVLLQTLMVFVQGKHKCRQVRVIIDTGSQRSYITTQLAAEMRYLSQGEENIKHQLFGGSESSEKKHNKYQAVLRNIDGAYECKINMLEQQSICGAVPRAKSGTWLSELRDKSIELSDVCNLSSQIEMLIGSDVAGKLFTGRREQLSSGLVDMETLLGWTLMGRVRSENIQTSVALIVTSEAIHTVDITNLWKLDLIGITDAEATKTRRNQNPLMESATLHFLNTVTRNEENRYEVHLPWVEGHATRPSNLTVARKRLNSSMRKLNAENKQMEYTEVFQDWLAEGIIEEVPPLELEMKSHYLPHRAVIKETSGTTKIRPVFDASARMKNSVSLNDCLEKGPNLIELIPSILLGFRENSIGVTADIRKAFLQISVRKEDRDSLRFLWWNESNSDIIVYRHKRVLFGVTSSPFLLCAVIHFHLGNAPCELTTSAQHLQKSFYVDNCVTSVGSEKELNQFICESCHLMNSGNFDLRGWEFTGDGQENKLTPILGLLWDREADTLQCNMEHWTELNMQVVTKRLMLSIVHKVFDPIGFTCPVTLCPKLLLQQTWAAKTSWDQEVTEPIMKQFQTWVNDLKYVKDIKISRWLRKSNSSKLSLHTFCDASSAAYTAVVYLCEEDGEEVSVQLIMAKSRVAPVKQVTIPKLELLAALVGARLVTFVRKNLTCVTKIESYLWSDSTTVLAWLGKTEVWGTFVKNRVNEIRELTEPNKWRHIPGNNNPADLPSRGCTAKQLAISRWSEGPEWLRKPEKEWPTSDMLYDKIAIEGEKKRSVVSLLSAVNFATNYSHYFSDYNAIVRTMGWQLRFLHNCKTTKEERKKGALSYDEKQNAELKLLFVVQNEAFAGKEGKSLQSLCAFKDDFNLYRIQTKIVRRSDTNSFRNPIVLPAKHYIVRLLIKAKHNRLLHAGVQLTMNSLREDYWILGGRRVVKSVINECVACRRQGSRRFQSVPVPLPLNRVRDAAIFETVGIDLAGPVTLKGGQKAWMVLFTCAVFQAVHLELVTSLSTEAFLQSFRRFVARRGRPTNVYTDNGTNFVGAENALNLIDWEVIKQFSETEKIRWIFNPPAAAWWGGFWERLIQMIKQLLKRVLGKAELHYEEFFTLLCDCEAIINSRPLTYMSDEPSDCLALTPAMFLQEIREIGVPDMDGIDHKSANKRLKYRQRLREELRKRFRQEYLGLLVPRSKRNIIQTKIKVGDIVLVEVDNVKRINWPLAKIIEVMPGQDGVARVVQVKTATGTLLRPIQKLYPLELTKESSEEFISKLPVSVKRKNTRVTETSRPPSDSYKTRSGRTVKLPDRYM